MNKLESRKARLAKAAGWLTAILCKLKKIDYRRLISPAQEQRQTVEEMRLSAAARVALVP